MSYQILHTLRVLCVALLFLALCLPLAACGKKPTQIDPPLGASESAFPRDYPDFSNESRP